MRYFLLEGGFYARSAVNARCWCMTAEHEAKAGGPISLSALLFLPFRLCLVNGIG